VKNPHLIGPCLYLRPVELDDVPPLQRWIDHGETTEWGKGHGTEATALVVRHAFDTMSRNRVWLRVYDLNPAGRRAYEKVGLRTEGVLREHWWREHWWREDRYGDTIFMAVLRREWDPKAAGL
jgi:RimJ/RimL family protein N-acetyltransferase